MNSNITIEKVGRRHYVRGNTYPIKDQLRAAGCKWDPDAKAWWTGKAPVAAQFAGATTDSAPSSPRPERPAPGLDATVAARATYKGRTYYVAGRVDRGRTQWDDEVHAVMTRDRTKVLLYYRDGSKSFWARQEMVQIVKSYGSPKTVRGLRAYAERAKREGYEPGGEYCYHTCPVGGFRCCPENGPCHDCE